MQVLVVFLFVFYQLLSSITRISNMIYQSNQYKPSVLCWRGLNWEPEVLTNRKFFDYNPFLVYCRELVPGTVSLTGDRAQGDDSKHDSHYNFTCEFNFFCINFGRNMHFNMD